MFLIAEPLRNLGKYTFADVVAYRLRQTPVRIAAAFGTLAVVVVLPDRADGGRGQPHQLLFGLSYETAVVIVGVVMLAYVLFGGMIATTWVQIVKAVLLLGGAFLLAMLVLARFSWSTRSPSSTAAADPLRRAGPGPGAARERSSRRDLARPRPHVRHRGPAPHPHALLHGARRPHRAHLGDLRHGLHRLLLPAHLHPRLRGHGARGPGRDPRRRQGRQHGGAAPGRGGGRHGLPRLHRRGGLRHHPGRGGRA